MKRLKIKDNIEKTKTQYSFWRAVTTSLKMFSYIASINLIALSVLLITTIPTNLILYAIAGLNSVGIAVGFIKETIDVISNKSQGNKELNQIAKDLSDEETKITKNNLKQAEILTHSKREDMINSISPQVEKTINDYIVIPISKGQLMVAREMFHQVHAGMKYELIRQDSSFEILPQHKVAEFAEKHPDLVQKVLTKKLKNSRKNKEAGSV